MADKLVPDIFANPLRINLNDESNSEVGNNDAEVNIYELLSAISSHSLLGWVIGSGKMPNHDVFRMLRRLRNGGTVELSLSRWRDDNLWLELTCTPDVTGVIEVRTSPKLASVRAEWEIAVVSLESKTAEAETTLKSEFCERLAGELPLGVLLSIPENGVPEQQKERVAWIETELAARNMPFPDLSGYRTTRTRINLPEEDMLLITYFPQRTPSVLEEWKEWVRIHVPGAFLKRMKANVARPQVEVVEVTLSQVLDSGSFSQIQAGDANISARDVIEERGTEALGWYQSYHEYDADHWGIYLHGSLLVGLGNELRVRLIEAGCPTPNAAFEVVNHLVVEHEVFHVRLETFALAHELIGRVPVYRKYTKAVYHRTRGTSNHLEEALANYTAYERIRKRVASWTTQRGWQTHHADLVLRFIEEVFDASPSGYRDWRLGAKPETWRTLATQTVSAKVASPSPCPPLEALLKTLFNDVTRLENVPLWMTTDGGIADRLFGTPDRREVARFLEIRGYVPDVGGKHPVYRGPNGTKIPLPTRDPLSSHVFHSILRKMGITKQEYMALRPTI